MRPYSSSARNANGHPCCGVSRQPIGKEGGNIVDTEKRLVQAIEGQSELGVTVLPCGKLRTPKHSAMKKGIARKRAEIYRHKDMSEIMLSLSQCIMFSLKSGRFPYARFSEQG
jgi:hypothetical protein